MPKSKVDEYLQQGMYGPKETNPDERRKYLGTLRERIVIALKQGQVKEEHVYVEVERAMKENKEAHLYLNGSIAYDYLSKYTKLANKYSIGFTMVTNKEHETDIGLVLAHSHAVNKEEIYVKTPIQNINLEQPEEKKGVFSFLNKFFQ
jgi:uncharacterized protein YueI